MYRGLCLFLFLLLGMACNQKKSSSSASIFEGTFSYMADANQFISCDQKTRMPVEMKGEYLTLEKQYTALSKGAGEQIYVRLEGYTKEVPSMEEGMKELAIIVTKVLEVDKDKSCK